ncbi:hypothetical protein [Allomesorhizobium alhagi]|uniref:Uncharacterized protein n=1 Tax=Mesorhizobium alhagi CCNWXJ12-2 TaxID=1107882 RepID=H0HR00_9HYPH|nr:hypothetical protein [Mesorhizobium alhagi]EHK56862.1 hypothetical protein MAXJ12_12912 [Mesorhizobium alhagi CCNWXJ12-2]
MIRWKANFKGQEVVGIGLEAGNIERLMNGEPVRVPAASMGLPFDILIHYGRDKDALVAELESLGAPLPEPKPIPDGGA